MKYENMARTFWNRDKLLQQPEYLLKSILDILRENGN
jgi:hypothetical protein